jgi:hypothetical protein
MTNSSRQDNIASEKAKEAEKTDSISVSDESQAEDISSSIATLLGVSGMWFSDLGKLLGAEANLSAASLNRLLLLTILIAQAIVTFIILAFVLIGLTLHETFNFGPFELSAIGLLVTGIIIFILKKLIRSTRKNLFPVATINQIRTASSVVTSAFKPESEPSFDETEAKNRKTKTAD